jgi:hypothetical protein
MRTDGDDALRVALSVRVLAKGGERRWVRRGEPGAGFVPLAVCLAFVIVCV